VDKRVDLSYEGENLQDKLAKATPGTSEYENLEKAVRENAYNQQFSGDIIETQKELNKLATHLAYCKEYKAEMTSQKAATQTAVLTSGQKENLEATKETSELVCAHNVANLETAKKGIVAEFDGIVTTVSATEGSNVAEGTDLVTLDSTENIILKLSVNKYDIVNVEEGQKATVRIKNKDYTGTVSRIARMTDKGAVGVGVEVTLDEPDDEIILGLEAKVKITSASKENVLRIPLDAIMGDDLEEYVYVYNNKKAVKKNIEIGVKNDDYAEVISGLSEGDIVVWNDAIELTDGCDVKVNQ
jgi:RND family efflux transporter MFP subunit